MPVEDVFVPKVKEKIDPTARGQPQDVTFWENKAREEEARTRYEVAKKEAASIANPQPAVQPEPAFKVTGGISLGNFDIQAQQAEMRAQMKEIQEKYEQQLAQINERSEGYRDAANALRIKMLQDQFQIQTDMLMRQIAQAQGQKPPSFTEQYEQLKNMALLMGYQPASTQITQPDLQIRMLQMQNEAAREQREFEWKMKEDERRWQLDLKKLDMDAATNMEKVKTERERNNMFASFPEMLGGAIARGLIDQGGATGITKSAGAPRKDNAFRIEAGEGEAGEASCPKCKGPIGIGPTTRTAVCPNCNIKIPVVRTPVTTVPATPQDGLAEEERNQDGR